MCVVCPFRGGVSSCPLVQAFGVVLPFVACSILLPALSLCAWRVALEYGSISRFQGVFSVVQGVCVGLSCLGALRGLWGFCVREWLGGLKACGVFASVFLLLLLCLPPFMLVVLLCSGCLSLSSCIVFEALWVCCQVFFFPCGLYAKRKGAISCVLSRSVVCVYILVQLLKNSVAVALAFSSSLGWYSHAIQQASDGLPVLTLIFSGIMSI